jgi:hypothetical protein
VQNVPEDLTEWWLEVTVKKRGVEMTEKNDFGRRVN